MNCNRVQTFPLPLGKTCENGLLEGLRVLRERDTRLHKILYRVCELLRKLGQVRAHVGRRKIDEIRKRGS